LLVPRFPAVLRKYMTGVTEWKSLLPGVETGRYGHYPLVMVSYRDLPETVSFDPLAIFEKRRAPAVVTRMLLGQEDESIRDELTSMAAQLYLPLVREALRMKRKIKWDRESIQALVEAVEDKEIFVKAVGEARIIKVLGKKRIIETLGKDDIIETLGEDSVIETLGEERVLGHFTVEQLEEYLRKKKQQRKP